MGIMAGPARVGAADVDAAAVEMMRVLRPRVGADWSVRAGSLEWTCWTTAAHVAHDLLAYAGQVAGRPGAAAYLPFDLVIASDASPGDVLDVVGACATLLGRAIAGASPSDRGWHWGPCDPEGFAAMGVAETVLHTYDITRGLGAAWLPPPSLCSAVLRRLFPDAPQGDPTRVLLWSTGRGDLDGHPWVTSWRWKAAVS
jgi:hypothetical protein